MFVGGPFLNSNEIGPVPGVTVHVMVTESLGFITVPDVGKMIALSAKASATTVDNATRAEVMKRILSLFVCLVGWY